MRVCSPWHILSAMEWRQSTSPWTKSISTENKFDIHKCSWESVKRRKVEWCVRRQSSLQLNYHFGVNLWANSIKKQSSSRQRKCREFRMRGKRAEEKRFSNQMCRGEENRAKIISGRFARFDWQKGWSLSLSLTPPHLHSLTHLPYEMFQGFNSSKSNRQSSLFTSTWTIWQLTRWRWRRRLQWELREKLTCENWVFLSVSRKSRLLAFSFDCVRWVSPHVWWRWRWCRWKTKDEWHGDEKANFPTIFLWMENQFPSTT